MPITLTQENTLIVRDINLDSVKEQKVKLDVFIIIPSTVIKNQMLRKPLTEGVDYLLEGDVTAERPGQYSVIIRGINQYEGRILAEWEILARNDPRVTMSPYRNQILGIEEPEEDVDTDEDIAKPICTKGVAEDLFYNEPVFVEHNPLPNYEELLQEWKEREHLKHLWVDYTVFQLPCSWHDCQDVVMPNDSFIKNVDGNCFRVAVSDGVTKSYRSADFAAILTRIYNEHGDRIFNDSRLLLAAKEWEAVQEKAIEHAFPNAPEQQKFEMRYVEHCSASATLNGVEFNLSSMTYKNSSVGDTVFFEVMRDGAEAVILSHNPPMSAEDFSNRPKQLSTKTRNGHYFKEDDVCVRFGMINLEYFYLICSDALAKFLLQEDEDFPQGEKLSCLLGITNDADFRTFCLEQRMNGRLADDDTTFVRIWFNKDTEV